ncbi:MAG TPA: ATP-binding protein [Chitinophagales bacterium]|nr:ATP-binding protein [Chitinophagales bacterium]
MGTRMSSSGVLSADRKNSSRFDALYKKALSCKNDKEYVKAIELYAELISQSTDPQCIRCAQLYEDTGDIYYTLKDFQRAFEFFQKALHIYAEKQAYDLQLNQYQKIGGMQQGIWQFKKAIDIFREGLSLSVRLNKPDKIVEFELLLGNVLNWDDNLPEAEKYLLSAIEKEKQLNLPMVRLRSHVSYAILLRKMKKYKDAERYFKQGMALSATLQDAYLMDITKSYGIMQYEMGNYDKAEQLLLDAEQKSHVEGNDATRAVILEYLALLYEKKQEFDKAYRYIRMFYERKLELLERGYSEDNNILQAKLGLEDARRERFIAEETAKAKGLFIATISHEIRTPMNIILGSTALMLKEEPKAEHIKYLEAMQRSGENLLGIINDILDISKMEAGKLEVEYEPVYLDHLLRNLEAIFGQSYTEKGLYLRFVWEENDFQQPFLSDSLRLTQMLTNLLGNAYKFTDTGGVEVRAWRKGKRLLFAVADTGVGIPKDKLKTVFEQYEQLQSSSKKKYKGTGLGLAIVKKIAALMNGTVRAKSSKKTGTEFTIDLPWHPADAAVQRAEVALPGANEFLKDKTILVVDDIDDNRLLVCKTLQYFYPAVKLLEARDGEEAVAAAQQHHPDLIVMDLDMPRMNGVEALAAIRKNKKMRTLTVIASTASLIANAEQELKSMGFDGYLPKPFEIEDFRLLLKEKLGA